jgi:hypothetical protein
MSDWRCIDSILDRVGTDLYDYRLSKCGYDHSKRRSQSAGYQRRQLHRHIEYYSRFHAIGSYLDASTVSHGFILDRGKYTTVNFSSAAGTVLTSINPSGQVSGFSCAVASCLSGITHSFVVSKKGVFTNFDPPGAISSLAATVIPSGAVVGAYTDSGRVGHGYLRSHGTFTTIDFPGAIFTFVGGSHPEGDSVGE